MALMSEIFSAVAADDASRLREFLQERPEWLRERDADGCTLLLIAARDGRLDSLKTLVENGADTEACDPLYRRTPLGWAAFNAHADVADYLLRKGADANASDAYGNTPLKIATMGREGAWDEWVAHMPHEYDALVEVLSVHGAKERHDEIDE